MAVFSVVFLLALVHQVLAEGSCNSKQHRSEYGFTLLDHVYHSFSTDHLSSCVIACNTQPPCQSFNYNLDNKICQFNNNTKEFRPKNFVKKAFSVYANNPNSESASWNKLNTATVCFGAKNKQFGRFEVSIGGSVEALKLVHVSGEVTCNLMPDAHTWSHFGCHKGGNLLTVITTSNDEILLPESQQTVYTLPGYHPDSEEIVFLDISTPLLLSSGEELRIWYGEDLIGQGAGDNNGSSCVDVYAKYL